MGVPDDVAINVAIIQRLLILLTALGGGIIYFREGLPKIKMSLTKAD